MSDWHPWSVCLTFFSQIMSSIFQKMHHLQLLQNQQPVSSIRKPPFGTPPPRLSARPWTGCPQHSPSRPALSSFVHLGRVVLWAFRGFSISQTSHDNSMNADCWTNHLLSNLALSLSNSSKDTPVMVMGWMVSPSKSICWRSNLQTPHMWLYLEMGPLKGN